MQRNFYLLPLLTVFSVSLFTACAIIHPPVTVEQVNQETGVRQVKQTLKQQLKQPQPALPNSVGVLPFRERGTDYGLGLAATEFFTANLARFKAFNLVDLSYSSLLEHEYATFSPQKKRRVLRAEQLVTGVIHYKDRRLAVAGVRMRDDDRKYKKIAIRRGDASEFFRLIADVNVYFLQQNGITVTKQMADQLYQIPTEKIEAYILYAKGKHQQYLGNFKAALNAYRSAQKVDPEFEQVEQSIDEVETQMTAAVPAPQPTADPVDDSEDEPMDPAPTVEEKYTPPVTESGNVVIKVRPGDVDGRVVIDFPLPEGF